MKHIFKNFLTLTLLASTGATLADSCCNTNNACNNSCNNSCNNDCGPSKPITCFVPRSQSFHNELKNAVMDPDIQFMYDAGFNSTFNLMFEYNHSFNSSNDISDCLFGPAAICLPGCDCDGETIGIKIVGTHANTVTGSAKPNGTSDLVADNFFLPKDFISTVTFEPSIENFNLHLQVYFGFDAWCTGLFARIYAPITISRWKLETCENIISKGTDTNGSYAAGEIAPVAVPTANLYTSFLQYAQGTPLTLPGSAAPVAAGPTVQALKYTRFGGCNTDTTVQLADLRAEFGWNFLIDEDYHLGIYAAGAAPTGNNCDTCKGLLWGAKAGNGKYWELGGGITGHYTFWRSENCEHQLDFFVDATINHMFEHNEFRTFDLKDANCNNKPLSRYIIAEQLTTQITNNLSIGETSPIYQFGAAYAPVANFSTQSVSVSFPVQADVMAKFVYTYCGFSWALGYDFWAQTCPHVEPNCSEFQDTFPINTWALRGDAHVYGFSFDSDFGGDIIQPIPATYNATTAFNIGTAFESGTPANANCGVDNSAAGAAVFFTDPITVAPFGVGNPICISNPPVFIKESDLDICNVTRGMSNSIFTELNYTWLERGCVVPYLGIGGRVEFGMNSENCVNVNPTVNNCNSCNECENCGTCTPTVWGVWIRGGLSFN
jgi:hypothetical protein